MSQQACSHEQAAEIVRVQHTLQASNDACVVYWRSMEVRQHPERSFYLECHGLKAYPDPQPSGHGFRSRSATANLENVKHEWESRLPG